MLKNGHLLRYPARSPSHGRGKESLLIRRDATLRIARLTGRERPRVPRKRNFAKLNLHLTVFEQPEKDDFFSSLLAERIEEDDFAPYSDESA